MGKTLATGVALLAMAAGAAQARGAGGRSGTAEGEAGHAALARSATFPTAPSGGRSDFRHGGFTRFGGASNGAWGFAHGDHGRRHRRVYGYPFGGPAYGYGADYAAGAGPYGPEAPYGDAAGEIGHRHTGPSYAPTLAQGAYGLGPAYRGRAYVSGQGAYAYGYPGFAETPALPVRPGCGC